MKKILAIILALTLVVGLAACSGSGSGGNTANAGENTNTAENTVDNKADNTNAAENAGENTNNAENTAANTGDNTNAAENTGDNTDTETAFNYSDYFNEDGYWKGITASEYVELPDLDKIEINRSDIESDIEYLLDYFPIESKVTEDRAINDTDDVNIDYVGYIDGVAFDGGSTNGQGTTVNIETTNYIDGFLPQLVGHKAGDTFDINVTFPDSYSNTDLAGKDAVFNITINYIVEMVTSEWTDEFVKENLSANYGWKTTAEAEDSIKAYYIENNIVENTTFKKDVPQEMKDFHKESAIEYYRNYASSYGMSFEEFLSTYLQVSSVDEFWSVIEEEAKTNAESYLVYQAIAEKQGYKVSDDDIDKYFVELYGVEDYSDSIEQYGLPYIKFNVLCEFVIRNLVPAATVID